MEEELQKPQASRSWWRWLAYGLGTLLILIGLAGFYLYYLVLGSNISPSPTQTRTVTFPKEASLSQVAEILYYQGIIYSTSDFMRVARWMNYEGKGGRYNILPEVRCNRDLVRVLRGEQAEVKLTFHNLRKKEQLPGLVAKHIQADSAELLALLQDPDYVQELGFTPETITTMLIPNTYSFHWDTDAKGFLARMKKEHERFWNEERRAKAKALNLSPAEVYILASIVETESQHKPERPRIAGVYLNRLRKGWKLEADPTVVFAHGDFELRRVLKRHLELDSPYNTYRYEGLPPGPIYLASTNSIEAVLNAETHEYMFFCARTDNSGAHAFAKTLSQHNANARAYHQWLNSRGR